MSEYDEEFRQMMQHEIAKLQSKIVYLEELYSHQERWIKVLDESVLEARKEAAHARNQNEILAVRLDTALALLEAGGHHNEKPPHY